ncbi:hypothetical protein GUITHDRAFT_155093 [Guillardia theta CCMP2712]|uniref:Uncharacterized protein n=1 Tax=Guillardia theta (strain CCMP2712) TaxID=905079 RepID=L1IL73_GUITC|nr:hypothetical protein GUITHDRAFT_155093 [Guillardia theta CCMP2712]EKX37008.1 hypothetical protein GUITHDRAFT_155093 [Guillardia theta CCMP2712]|eukprot:XP_005823988.1 hypothetical protein GUITHDRAFT_155093 [Guillardia theta CCMP2712]
MRSLGYAAIALVAAVALVGAGSLSSRSQSSLSPEQTYLLQMWDRPYVTTTMLWNAAHNDNGLGDSNGDGSSSYEAYDTFGHNGGNSLQGEIDSDLKQILPSSELKTSSGSSNSWSTSALADSDWGRHTSNYDWDGPDAHVHSWDSDQQVQMKSELRKMYSKGIDHISKKITEQAEKDAGGGFYSKWAKLAGNKISKGHKIGLSQNQAKLFKEAEKSEEKEEAKKASYVKAIKTASVKQEASDKHEDKSAQQAAVKAKIHAADRLAAKLNSHKSHSSKHASSSKEPVAPSEDPGKIGDKSAVKELRKTLSGAKNAAAKAAARKKMAALEQQIKRDFDSVTSYAHKVRTSLPPMKA